MILQNKPVIVSVIFRLLIILGKKLTQVSVWATCHWTIHRLTMLVKHSDIHLQAPSPLLPPAWGKSKRRRAVMYSGWPPLSKDGRNQPYLFIYLVFCFSIPIKEEQKGGTAFPHSPSLIIAFWEQAHINFCHPKHHLVLLRHGLVLIHQQTPAVPPGLSEDRASVALFQCKRPLSLGLWHQLSHFTGRRKQGPPIHCNMSQHLAAGPSPSFHYFQAQKWTSRT